MVGGWGVRMRPPVGAVAGPARSDHAGNPLNVYGRIVWGLRGRICMTGSAPPLWSATFPDVFGGKELHEGSNAVGVTAPSGMVSRV